MPHRRELLIIICDQNNNGRVTGQLSHRLSAGASRQGAITFTKKIRRILNPNPLYAVLAVNILIDIECSSTYTCVCSICIEFYLPFYFQSTIKQKRSTEGCSKFKGPETRQVQERLVSTLEHMQVPKWDRTRCPEK